jgi:hypothetical protein
MYKEWLGEFRREYERDGEYEEREGKMEDNDISLEGK